MRARQSSSAWAGSWPSTLTSPAERIRKPSRISIVVVLPAPFGPSRQTTSPAADVEVDTGEHVVLAVPHPQVADRDHIVHRLESSRAAPSRHLGFVPTATRPE